ncbi:hypothetical protein D3C80_1531330 [compost metagenome]
MLHQQLPCLYLPKVQLMAMRCALKTCKLELPALNWLVKFVQVLKNILRFKQDKPFVFLLGANYQTQQILWLDRKLLRVAINKRL